MVIRRLIIKLKEGIQYGGMYPQERHIILANPEAVSMIA